MILRDIGGNRFFELHILRYQFSDATKVSGSDLGWLMVSIRLRDELGEWKAVGPVLEYDDACLLSACFRKGSEVGLSRRFITFTEPCLAFEFKKRRCEDRALTIYLGHEFRPPDRPIRRKKIPAWRPDGSQTGFYLKFVPIEFTVTLEDMRQCADSIIAEVQRLPSRKGIPGLQYRPEYLAELGLLPEDISAAIPSGDQS